MKQTPTFDEMIEGQSLSLQPLTGCFKSSIPLEVLWSINHHHLYPFGSDFLNLGFIRWFEKTWRVGLKQFNPKQLELKMPVEWEIELEMANGTRLEPLKVALTPENVMKFLCMATAVSEDYADKVVYNPPGILLVMAFDQPLLCARYGTFTARKIDENDNRVVDLLHSRFVPAKSQDEGEKVLEQYSDWLKWR